MQVDQFNCTISHLWYVVHHTLYPCYPLSLSGACGLQLARKADTVRSARCAQFPKFFIFNMLHTRWTRIFLVYNGTAPARTLSKVFRARAGVL
jgi:hypothetical protein